MSGTLNEQLQQIAETKSEIASAINAKGIQVNDNDAFATYATKIRQIQGEGGSGNAFNLFDTKLSDHILEGTEALGWALQGTPVSKQDYPAFYEKCLQEYNESSDDNIVSWTQPRIQDNGVMGGDTFAVSTDIVLHLHYDIFRAFNPQEYGLFHGESGYTLGHIDIYNPTPLNITCLKFVNQPVAPNRASAAGNIYGSHDGNEWTLITSYTNNVQDAGASWNIDLNDNKNYYKYYRIDNTSMSSANDSYWTIQEINIVANCKFGKQHSNGHKFYDISYKSTIDEQFEKTGMAWLYGIDQENEQIILPRNIWFEQASLDDLGNVESGLPNITASVGAILGTNTAAGSFSNSVFGDKYTADSSNSNYWLTSTLNLNASLSNPVYGNSDTVQPNAIKKLLYICVGNTVKADAIIDLSKEIELNNPFFLGQSQYFENEPNNLSWLKSAGQWNSKDVYTDYYDWLLKERNNPTSLNATCNVTKVGSLIDKNGVLSGFTKGNYASIPTPNFSQADTWEVVFCGQLTSELTELACLLASSLNNQLLNLLVTNERKVGFALGNSDGTAWNVTESTAVGSTVLELNKDYWIKLNFTGTEYVLSLSENGVEYNVEYTYTYSEKLPYDSSYTCYIGRGRSATNYIWTGSLNLKESYIKIDGSYYWIGANSVKQIGTTDVITDYDFVINPENETFRLPLLNGSESIPGTSFINLTTPSKGEVVTAPSNGRYIWRANIGTAGSYLYLLNNSTGDYSLGTSSVANHVVSGALDVRRNDTVTINTTITGASSYFRFIPYVGNGSLYYFVGEAVNNANLVNVANVTKALANKVDINSDRFDGPWVSKHISLVGSEGASFSSSNVVYDLSEYLPNDGYNYEVIVSSYINTAAKSGSYACVYIGSDIMTSSIYLGACITRTSSNAQAAGSVVCPVGYGRYIFVQGTNASGSYSLHVNGYRRLGKI